MPCRCPRVEDLVVVRSIFRIYFLYLVGSNLLKRFVFQNKFEWFIDEIIRVKSINQSLHQSINKAKQEKVIKV